MTFDYQQLADAINTQIAPLYHTTVIPVEYVGQGDFPWYYQNQNQVFNQWTFDYLSARVSPGSAPGLARLSASGGFPNAYASLLSIMQYAPSTADATNPTVRDDVAYGTWLLAQLVANTRQPTAATGGINTVDPVTGAVSTQVQVGYQVTSSIAALDNALADTASVLTVYLPGAAGSSVQINYPGYTLVSTAVRAWQQATNVGWYDPDPIQAAYRNAGQDVTGYTFTSAPPYRAGDLAAGGDLGRVAALLISGQPTTVVHPPKATMSGTSAGPTTSEILSALGAVGIVARPPDRTNASAALLASNGLPVPQLQQTAYVIGVCLDFPASD